MAIRYFTSPMLKVLAIVLIVAGFVIYVRVATRIAAPAERNRVTHIVGGYSIVRPDDWEAKTVYASGDRKYKDILEIRPKTGKGGANEPRIFIGRFRDAPDLQEIRNRDQPAGKGFNNYDAEIFTGFYRRESFWRAIINHGGEWYELVLWLPDRADVNTSDLMPYVKTFRAPDVPPTTMPGTSAATTTLSD